MQGKNNGSAIALSFLIVGGIGAIVYYFFLRKKNATATTMAGAKILPLNQNIADKIKTGYNDGLLVLSASEIKKYSGWIDAAETAAKNYLTTKGTNATIEYNLNTVTNFPDNNFLSVVNKWMLARGVTDLRETNLLKALGNLVDPTYDAVSNFYAKAVKLKIASQ